MAIRIPSLFDWAASEGTTRKKQKEKTPVIIPSFDAFVKSEREKTGIEAQRRKAPLSLPPEDEIFTPPTRRSPKTPIDYVGPIPIGIIPEEIDKTTADFLRVATEFQREQIFHPVLSATDEHTLALIYDQDTAKEAKGIRAKPMEWPTTKLAKGLEKTVSKLQKLPGAKIPVISEALGLGSKVFVDALFSLQGLFEISTGGKGIDDHRLLAPMYKQYVDELRNEGITDIKNWQDFKKSYNIAMHLWSDEGATDEALRELGLRTPGELKEVAGQKYQTPLGSGYVISEVGRDLLNMGVEIAAVSYITSQIPLVGTVYKAMTGIPKESVLGAIYTYAEQGAKHGRIPDWEEVQMNMMMFPVIGQTLRAAGRGMKYGFKGASKAAIATPEMLDALKNRVNRSSLAYIEKYGEPPLTPFENLMISKATGEVMPGERFWKLPERQGAIPTEGFPEVLGKELPAYRAEMRKGTEFERETLDRAPPDIPAEDDLIIEEIKRTPSEDLRNELHGAYGDDASPYIAAMTRTELEYLVSGGRILPGFPVGDMTFQNVFSIDKLQRAARGKKAVEDIIGEGAEKDVSRETLEGEAEAEPGVAVKKPLAVGKKAEKPAEVKDKYVPGNAKDMKDIETVVRDLIDKGEINEATKILDENIEWFPENRKAIRARNSDLTQKEVNGVLRRNRESNNKMKDLIEKLERDYIEERPFESPELEEEWKDINKRLAEIKDSEFIDKVEAESLIAKGDWNRGGARLEHKMRIEIKRREKLIDEYAEKQKGPAEEKPLAPPAKEAKLPEGELTYEEFRKWAAENHPDEDIREMAQAPESADPMSPHGLMLDVVWREARAKAEAPKVEPKAEEPKVEEKPGEPKEEELTWQEKRKRVEEESYQEGVENSMQGVWGTLDNANVDTKTLSTFIDGIINDAVKRGIVDNNKVFAEIMTMVRSFKGADESLSTAQISLLDYWAGKRLAGTESRTLSELFKGKKVEEKPPEIKPPEETVTDTEKLYDALTKEVAEEHKRFEKPSELRKWANEQLGKEANVDDIWDALETIIVKLRQNRTDLRDYNLYERMKRVKNLEELLPNRPRTLEATSEINQQFSTPLELAEAMRVAANVRSTDFVLEPTAGTGSLLAPFDKIKTADTPARIAAIEMSPRRVRLLKRIGIDAKEANYLETDVVKEFGEKPDVILANPPWAGRGRSPLARAAKLPDIAANFVNKMLADLKEGGRLVTLMPTTVLTSSEALPWLRSVAKNNIIKGIIVTPEGMYTARRGTDVPSVMLVIDKGKAPEGFKGAIIGNRPFTGTKGQFTEKDAEILNTVFKEFGDKEYNEILPTESKRDFADIAEKFRGMMISPSRHKFRRTMPRSEPTTPPTIPEGAKAPGALPEVVPEGKIRIGRGDSAVDIDILEGEPGGPKLGLPSRIEPKIEKKWKLLGAFYGDRLDKIPEDIILKVNDLKSRGLDTRMMVADAPQNKAGLYRNSKGEWQKEPVKLYYLQGEEYVPVTKSEVERPPGPAPEAGEPGRKPVSERERPEPGGTTRPGEAPGGGRVPTERPGKPGELPGEGGVRPGVVPGQQPGGRPGEPVSQKPAPESPGESPKAISPIETRVINEIYSEYIPRYNLRGVKNHPSRVIESSHIAAVSKPNLNDVELSERVIKSALDGKISDIQIDNVAATEKAFELYKNNPLGHAFVVADQVGVGKSRQAAAAAMQWLDSGRSDVLLVMTKDKHAIKDLMREFDIISEGDKFPYPMYDIPRQFPETTNLKGGDIPKFAKAVYFMDWYNTSNYSEALKRLKPNGLIGDECHKWANVYDSDRGLAWKELHKDLRGKDGGNLPTMYMSATTGEFIEGMEYLYNLGLWSPEEGSFGNWLRTLKGQLKGKAKRKPGGIEAETSESIKEDVGSVFKSKLSRISPNMTEQIVAEFSMKGLASFRDILREGTEFEVIHTDITGLEIPAEFRMPIQRVLPSVGRPGVLPSIKEVGTDFRKSADELYSPKLDARTKAEIETATKHRKRYDKAIELMREYKILYDNWKHLNRHSKKKSRFGFGAHSQELVKSLLFDIKLDMALPKAAQYVKEGKQVVLSVIRVSGEARENIEGKQTFDPSVDLDIIDARLNLPGRIRAMLDLLATRDFSKPESSGQIITEAEMAKAELTERFRNEWPMIDHPIEKIINVAGGRDKVALMVSSYTDLKGKKHMVKPGDRAVDNQLFQDGKIKWSVISASGKESINLHDISGTGRRVYQYLDPDWSVKLLMQGYGRVDRTGQKTSPLIQFYNTGSAAEKRFFYSAVQRMSQLGATSKGTEAGVTGKTELAEYGIPRPLQRIAIQEAWEVLDYELKEWFMHKDYRDSYGNPHRRLENVDIEHFWRQFQFIPIEEGRLIGEVYQGAVRKVLYKNARDTFSKLEDEGVDVTPYWEEFNRGKIVQDILQGRRHSGEILRDTKLKGDLTLHEVKDVDGHKYGVLSGMVTPNIMRIREHLPRSGSTAGGPRLDFIRFRSKDRVVSGLQIQKTRVKAVAALFGRDVSGYKVTPETMISDLKAGDVITLQNGWRMYQGRGGARANKIIIQGAKMKDLTYQEAGINKVKAGAEYDPGGFFWIPNKNVPRFVKEYPISTEPPPKPGEILTAEGAIQALPEGKKPTKLTTRITRERKGVKLTGEDVLEEPGTRLVTQKGEIATEKQIRREKKKLLKQIKKRKGMPVREQSVVEFLENEIGTPFRLGHHSWLRGKFKKALGLFKIREKAVRLGTGYDLRVSTHELGHRVDQMLDMSKEAILRDVHYDLIDLGTDLYPKAKVEVQIKEGFAEFMFDYLFSPKAARKHAPDFYEFFVRKVKTEAPTLWEVLEKTIDDIAIMKNMDEAAFLHSIKSPGMKIRDDVAITDKIYNVVVDDAQFVKRAVMEAHGGKLPDDVLKDPFKRIELFRGWTAEAMSTLKKGWIDKKTGKKIAPGLEETLEPVRKVIDTFEDYYMGKALLESAKRGQEVPIPDWYKRLRKGPTIKDIDSPEYKKVYADYLREWHKKTPGEKKAEPQMGEKSYYEKIYQSAAILEEGNRLLLEKYPEFESVRQGVWEFGNRSLGQTVGHFISKALFKMLSKRWPHHATLFRVFERDYAGGAKGSKFANLTSPVKGRGGSFRPVIPPLESLIKNHFMFTNMVGRNKVAKAFYELGAENPGLAKWVEVDIPLPLHVTKFQLAEITSFLKRAGLDISTSKDGKTGIVGDIATAEAGQFFDLEHLAKIFRPSHFLRGKDNLAGAWFDGKYKVMRVHPRVYETFMGLDAEMGARAVKFFRLFGTPARMLRAGAILTPEFVFRNPARDIVNSMVYSHYASREPITRMVQKAYDFVWALGEILGDTEFYHLWMQSGGPHGTLVSLDTNYLSKSLRSLLKQKMSQKMVNAIKPSSWIEALRMISEVPENATRLGEFRRGLLKEGLGEEGVARGALASRDITLDFQRMGLMGKPLNQVIAFFNAAVQGTDKMVREFKNRPVESTMYAFSYVTVPSYLLFLMNMDNPEYWKLSRWRRDLFWNIPITDDTWLTIPKPFELGILFGALPERFFEAHYTDNPKPFKEIGERIIEAGSPSLLPNVLIPAIEWMANKSIFTEIPLVPQAREEKGEEWFKYRGYTSETMKLIGKAFNISPSKMQNAMRAWTGGLGQHALHAFDYIGKNTGVFPEGPTKPSQPTLTTIPGIKGFIRRGGVTQNFWINEFYDLKKETDKASYMIQQIKGDELDKYIAEHEKELDWSKDVNKEARELSALRKQINEIYIDEKLSEDEKRFYIEGIYEEMGMIAKELVEYYYSY